MCIRQGIGRRKGGRGGKLIGGGFIRIEGGIGVGLVAGGGGFVTMGGLFFETLLRVCVGQEGAR